MLRRIMLLAATALAVGSCGSEDAPATARDAGVYATIIRELAPEEPDDPGAGTEERDPVVYAGPLDDQVKISLEVQVAVVEELEGFAAIRFVDTTNEAIDDEKEGEPVLESGVLLRLGAVPGGRSPSVEAERYVDLDHTARFRVTVERSDGDWRVVNATRDPA